MVSIRLDQALDYQLDLIKGWGGAAGPQMGISVVMEWSEQSPGTHLPIPVQGAQVALKNREMLERAETFWIDADFVSLIEGVSRELEEYPVLATTDLFVKNGFAVLERPLRSIDNDAKPMGVTAFVWQPGPISQSDGTQVQGVVITQYLHANDFPKQVIEQQEKMAGQHPLWMAPLSAPIPGWPSPLRPIEVTGWGFNHEWDAIPWDKALEVHGRGNRIAEEDPDIDPRDAMRQAYEEVGVARPSSYTVHPALAQSRREFYTFHHLVAQHVMQTRSPRAARKRWEREVIVPSPNYGDIRVVRLRRAEQVETGDRQDREEPYPYSHRFVVRGHWRNQWYPSEERHKMIWIDPFVKGPKDKPLIVRDRLFKVDR